MVSSSSSPSIETEKKTEMVENEAAGNDDRCMKRGRRGWSCPFPRAGGKRLCEKHLIQGKQSRVTVSSSPPSIETEKKTEMVETEAAGNDDRCKKTGGGGWRCPFPRSGGKRFCEKHLIQGKQSRVTVSSSSPSIQAEKKTEMAVTEYDDSAASSRVRVSTDSATQFKAGEIWAFSKESDSGLPKSYARIDRVLADSIEVTPLIPLPVLDQEVSFIEKGLTLACGIFKPSQSTVTMKASAFSHNVPFERDDDQRSFYRIFPKTGEIWAMYVKWDGPSMGFEYNLVEVVSDFDEENGVTVFWLARVEGKEEGYYRRQVYQGFELIRCCSRGFMPVFSHRVPARRIVDGDKVLWKVGLH